MFDARRPSSCAAIRPGLKVWAAGLALSAWTLVAQAQLQQPSPTPPAGMVMGAYGQSLQQAQPAAATAADPVSRFLQERRVLSQAQGESSRLLDQMRDSASEAVLSAMNFLGVRYTRGGNTVESGFDCSGFTRHIFELSVGLVLPRRADEQAKMSSLISIKQDELKPGDLVFFNTMRQTFSHVGIYVGEGKFIHAPRAGAAVRVEDMREAYWAKRFTGGRRADINKTADSGKLLTR